MPKPRKRQPKVPKEPTAKDKLHQKLKEMKMGRKTDFSLDLQAEKLEEKLETTKSGKEKKKIEEDLKLIEKVFDTRDVTVNEFPEYADNFGYGGSTEHND